MNLELSVLVVQRTLALCLGFWQRCISEVGWNCLKGKIEY